MAASPTADAVNVNVGVLGHVDSGKTSLGSRGEAGVRARRRLTSPASPSARPLDEFFNGVAGQAPTESATWNHPRSGLLLLHCGCAQSGEGCVAPRGRQDRLSTTFMRPAPARTRILQGSIHSCRLSGPCIPHSHHNRRRSDHRHGAARPPMERFPRAHVPTPWPVAPR